MNRTFFFLAVPLLLFAGCQKETDEPPPAGVTPEQTSLSLSLRFEVDGTPLQLNSLQYVNAAGNQYSVESLRFYLSQISLIKDDSSMVPVKDYLYADADLTHTLNTEITGMPAGCYTGLRFHIGIDPAHNVEGGLPSNAQNLAMEWPSVMGGGYHFLKLEGYFSDSTGMPGYAMHLGTDSCLVNDICIPATLCFQTGLGVHRTLVMNVNEWFRNPSVYDFQTDGNYSMGDTLAMLKLRDNGRDVFTLE